MRNKQYWMLGVVYFGALLSAQAALLPSQFSGLGKTGSGAQVLAQPAVGQEYGLEETEQAQYGPDVTVTAYRAKDTTGAYGLFQWQRPEGAKPVSLGDHSAAWNRGALVLSANYVLRFDGLVPTASQLQEVTRGLPGVSRAALPILLQRLPHKTRLPNSERMILGPATLEAFEPRLPAAAAGFDQGAEGELAKFKAPGEPVTLALFAYPTPAIARQRSAEWEKVPGLLVKRAGPLVGISIGEQRTGQALLGQVDHQWNLTWNEEVPKKQPNPGQFLLDVFTLAGVLITLSIMMGLIFGSFRLFSRRRPGQGAPEPMILLHLGDQ